jgi:hypothetical protein
MADKKISALTAASTPLAGTEVLPIVQSGATVKATVENVATATQPNGTAKGVVYLNASKIPTTGTNLTFDGTSFGLGTVPSTSSLPSFESPYGIFLGQTQSYFASNAYFNGGWLYYGTGLATKYACVAGTHQWSNAVSGTAGNAITFVDQLTLGATGNLTVNTGNLVIGTSGKGIDFSATAGTGTSELLADYEEGIFTPTVGGTWVANPTDLNGTYTKIGRMVYVTATFVGGAKAGATNGWIDSLPFNVNISGTGAVVDSNIANYGLALAANTTRIWLTANAFGAGTNYVSIMYMV